MWIAIQNAVGARQGVGGGPTPPPYTPPLDAYPADIAYSVRKLSSSYTGPAIEVQRNPGGQTQDIYFDSNGLIDTTALATFAAGAELRVRTLYDQTGNGRHATTTASADMSYIYSGTAVYEANEIPVITPRNSSDGFYPITGTYSTAANNTVFAVLSSGMVSGSYLMARPPLGSPGILMAGIECPTGGCTSGADYGFGTTQYYRDGAYYGGTGTGLTRDDFAQSSISSQRIYGVGFTQSGLVDITMGRAGNTSIYATQEFIVYFSDQLGTTPRQALEQNLNSYYQSSNLPDYTSGFLADYPDAAVAYSVRKLSNTAIKCMRVRRAVAPFDEKNIGFTPAGDLDEAAIVAFGGSDELRVSAWYDQSGNSNHATQIAPNSQPQIYDGAAVIIDNGKPALDLDGTDDYFEVPSTQWSDGEVGVGVVMNANYSAGSNTYLQTLTGVLRGAYGSGGSFIVHIGTTPNQTNASNPTNGQRLITWDVSSGTASLRYDTSVAATQSITGSISTASSGAEIGRRTNNSSYVDGTMQELIVWQTGTNIPAIESNINGYFDIYTLYNPDPATSGFLFDYPDASAAYSVRQLNNNATSALRVRRLVAPFDELDIGFTPAGDLDETAITTFGGSDELSVSRFYDQTGDQNHTADVGATAQLRIYDGTNVIKKNGKPIAQVHVSAGNSNASYNIKTPAPVSLTHSLYSVVQRPSAPNALNMFSTSNTGVTALYQDRAGNLTYGPGWTSFGIYTYPTVSNQPRLYCYIRKNGTDGECFNDGVSRGTTTALGASTQINIKGWRSDRGSTGIQADCGGMQEFIAYPDDRTSVGDNTNILSNIKGYFTGIP